MVKDSWELKSYRQLDIEDSYPIAQMCLVRNYTSA